VDGTRYGRLEEDADVGAPVEGEAEVSQFYECEEDEALMASEEATAPSSPAAASAPSTPPGSPERATLPAPAASSEASSSSSTAPAVLQPATRSARELPLRAAAAQATAAPAATERRLESEEEEPGGGSVAIEMRSLISQTSASSAADGSAAVAAPAVGGVSSSEPSSASTAPGAGSPDRHCFICLQDEDEENPLTPCCTTCFARVHVRCWREWRNNQRITALRSRLLGLRMQTNHLLRCTICKSGTALVAGEEDGLEWMNELLCGGEVGRTEGAPPQTGGPMRRDESDEDNDAQFEELVDMKTCLALVVYLGVLILVLLIACLLIVMQRFYAGDVILCCIIALYELSVLQIVALAASASAPAAMSEDTAGADGDSEQSNLATAV